MDPYSKIVLLGSLLASANVPCQADIILSGCADISRPGHYTLDRDISGTLGAACLRFHDGSDIHLDCAGHSVTTGVEGLAAVVIETVKNFTLSACSLPQLSGYSLFIGNSSNGLIVHNTIKDMVVNEPDRDAAASLRVVGNRFSEFDKRDFDASLTEERDSGVIPIESGVNWVEAKAMELSLPLETPEIGPVSSKNVSARAYPNPWRADRDNGGKVTFDQLPANSTVKIFSVAARWVQSIQANGSSAEWDLRNAAGQNAASGIYLYLVTNSSGEKASGKVAVIR